MIFSDIDTKSITGNFNAWKTTLHWNLSNFRLQEGFQNRPCAQVFKRAVREVKAGQTALEAGEGRGGDSTYFNRTIVILLHLVCLLTKLIPHLEKEKVSQACKNILKDQAKVELYPVRQFTAAKGLACWALCPFGWAVYPSSKSTFVQPLHGLWGWSKTVDSLNISGGL